MGADSSLEFLRAVYSDPGQPIARRMRAAIAALPFEHPKLAVTANIDGGPGFAARLEEAFRRSRAVAGPMIEGTLAPAEAANGGMAHPEGSRDIS
jgi:hypothetical protein